MKNALIYYYNLNPTNIHQLKEMYKFTINNEFYALIEVDMDIKKIEEIYTLSNDLNRRGVYTHQILLNTFNSILTIINNKKYVLLKTYDKMDKKIDLKDILTFSNLTVNNYQINTETWYQKWIKKVDYFEYQINELGKKYPLIKTSFNYFSGITETAIQLLVNEKIDKNKLCVCHQRIKKNCTLFELYNPFNFIIDYNVRDVAEYLKEFILTDDYYNILEEFLNTNPSIEELKLFFIRIIYPSFYFDICEEIIDNKENEDKVLEIISKIDIYEKALKKTYTKIKSICLLSDIEWLT